MKADIILISVQLKLINSLGGPCPLILACVACAKRGGKGGGSSLRSKRFQSSYCANLSPPPSPSFIFFGSCPSFLDEPREETLATQAREGEKHERGEREGGPP